MKYRADCIKTNLQDSIDRSLAKGLKPPTQIVELLDLVSGDKDSQVRVVKHFLKYLKKNSEMTLLHRGPK